MKWKNRNTTLPTTKNTRGVDAINSNKICCDGISPVFLIRLFLFVLLLLFVRFILCLFLFSLSLSLFLVFLIDNNNANRKRQAVQYISTVARLIAPVIGKAMESGYNYLTDLLRFALSGNRSRTGKPKSGRIFQIETWSGPRNPEGVCEDRRGTCRSSRHQPCLCHFLEGDIASTEKYASPPLNANSTMPRHLSTSATRFLRVACLTRRRNCIRRH